MNHKTAAPLTHNLLARKGQATVAAWRDGSVHPSSGPTVVKLADRSMPNQSSGAPSDPEPTPATAPEASPAPEAGPAPESSPAKGAARWRLPALALVLVLGIAGGMAAFDIFSTPASNPPALAPLALDDAKTGAVIAIQGDTISPRQPGDGATRLAAEPKPATPAPAAQEPAAQEPATTIPEFELNTARLAPPATPKPARPAVAKPAQPAAAKSAKLPGKPAAAVVATLDNSAGIAPPPPKISVPATVAPQKAVAPPKSVAAPKTVRTAKRPPAKVAAVSRSYTVQFASLKSRGAAGREWSRLKKRFSGLLAGFEPAIKRASVARRGVFYRLRAGAFTTRKAARTLCKAMQLRRQSCLVILR